MSARIRLLQRMAVVCGACTFAVSACATAEYEADPVDTPDPRGGASGASGSSARGGAPMSGRGGSTSGGSLGVGGSAGKNQGLGGSAGRAGLGGGTGNGTSGASGMTGSTGGSVATGGSGGSSGAGGGAGSGGQGGAPVAVDGFSVNYKALNTAASAAAVECQLVIANAGKLTVPLSDFTLRYYLTSEVPSPVVSINWAGLNPGFTDLKGSLVTSFTKLTPSKAGADAYVDLAFSASAPAISPGKTAEISWKVHAADYSIQLLQTGDYSFDPSKSGEPVAWTHVVLLRNGNVVWGSPP